MFEILSRELVGSERTAAIGVAPDVQDPGFRIHHMSKGGRLLSRAVQHRAAPPQQRLGWQGSTHCRHSETLARVAAHVAKQSFE